MIGWAGLLGALLSNQRRIGFTPPSVSSVAGVKCKRWWNLRWATHFGGGGETPNSGARRQQEVDELGSQLLCNCRPGLRAGISVRGVAGTGLAGRRTGGGKRWRSSATRIILTSILILGASTSTSIGTAGVRPPPPRPAAHPRDLRLAEL